MYTAGDETTLQIFGLASALCISWLYSARGKYSSNTSSWLCAWGGLGTKLVNTTLQLLSTRVVSFRSVLLSGRSRPKVQINFAMVTTAQRPWYWLLSDAHAVPSQLCVYGNHVIRFHYDKTHIMQSHAVWAKLYSRLKEISIKEEVIVHVRVRDKLIDVYGTT